ncbi:hypothetical protein KKD52_17450 [Myxococcota bacterium]|nr:hypothetical protein [Myxococcota bacterium]MBU1512142.1 hypothetical protein [Myxococcota bacterium]
MSNPNRFFFLSFLSWLFLLSSCQETYQLRFELVTPAGFDLQQDVARLVISAGEQTRVVTCTSADCPFDVKFSFTEGETSRVSVHGYDADSQLVAAGYSPSFVAVDGGLDLALFLGPIDRGSTIDALFEAAPLDAALAPLLTSDDGALTSNVGTLIFGGREGETGDATPVDEVWFYDPYLLSLVSLAPLTIPLAEPAIMDLRDGNFLLFGGRTTGGTISGAMLFYATSSVQAAGSHVISLPAETAPVPTAGARTVELGPFDGLFDQATGTYLLDAFLMLSGETVDGSEAPITWVLVYYSLASATTTIVTRPTGLTLPQGVHAQAVRLDDTIVRVFLPEVRQFLTAAVDVGTEGLEFRLDPMDAPGLPVRSGWRLLPLGDRLLAVAGRDDQGRCTGEIYDVDPVGQTLRGLDSRNSHCESALVRMGALVLEVGGVDAEEGLHGATAWPWTLGDGGLSLQGPVSIPLARERIRPQVFVMPTGAVAVYGGLVQAGGSPELSLELIILDPRKSQEPK